MRVAERCRAAVEAADWAGRGVTVSVGVSTLALGVQDGDDLLEEADRALYEAKRGGRNCVRGAQPPGSEASPTRA